MTSSPVVSENITLAARSQVERMTGIEPALSAWEADVLPLNYIRRSHPGPGKGSCAVLANTCYRNSGLAWCSSAIQSMVLRGMGRAARHPMPCHRRVN
jgi:hypothetical protein